MSDTRSGTSQGGAPEAAASTRTTPSHGHGHGHSDHQADLKACADSIRKGSKSFHLASLLLPPETRKAAVALYAFCRHSDDLIDDPRSDRKSLGQLRERLHLIYRGTPADYPCDRAFQRTVEDYAIPECIPHALLDGFAMDIANRRYRTLEELKEYATGVAATVGLMMSLIMRSGEEQVLARAADLGIAMQLTNIARDVGEDARNGRIYLPIDWLKEAGINPETFLVSPRFTPELGEVVRRLLSEAERHYRLGHTGIAALPANCRHAIRTAAFVYEEIGAEVAANGYDSVTRRAHTSLMRKVALLAAARRPVNMRALVSESALKISADASAAELVKAAAQSFSLAEARQPQRSDRTTGSATEHLLSIMIRQQNENRRDVLFHRTAARQRAASLI